MTRSTVPEQGNPLRVFAAERDDRPRSAVAPFRALRRVGSCPSGQLGLISNESGVVYELDAEGIPCATISGFDNPQGLSVDQQGNVYVANDFASNIVEFNALSGALVNVFDDPGEYPEDVAVDTHGNLAVTNLETPNLGAGNVLFYAAGSTHPTGSASSADYPSPRFCAFDKQGNLVFDDISPNFGAVNVGVIFEGNVRNQFAVIHPLNGATIQYPGGVQILNTPGPYGTLVIMDQGSTENGGQQIDTYKSFSYPNLGPASVTRLQGTEDPSGFAFVKENVVLVADSSLGRADLYTYPNGSLLQFYTVPDDGIPVGAGAYPTQQF